MGEDRGRVIALGFFDGVHCGHRALFDRTVQLAVEKDLTPSVISFDTHPSKMVTGKKVPLINSPFDRWEILSRGFGINDIIFLHFDDELRHMSWKDFVDWLVEGFNARHLVAGYDFTFGYRGAGNVERLRQRCEELKVGCDIIQKVTIGGVAVSSTYIRKLLSEGDIERANLFLGHPHTFSNVVRYGYRFGRTMGIPTINMQFPEGTQTMKNGVYAAKAFLQDGREYTGVTNIGVRPTVGGKDTVSVETHLLGYSGNLYGQTVRIEFHKYLRPEVKYPNTEALKSQIESDIRAAKEYFGE